ncbi:hypothetical protein KJ682_13435 [bacterium]|nr:hypothetical protein [bacterium]
MQPKTEPVPVKVTEIRTEDGLVYQVQPPEVHVQPGQTINFRYVGEAGATLFIPISGVFPQRVYDFTRETTGFSLSVTVGKKVPAGVSSFAFGLYSRDKDDFAIGNSPPRMIIDPPDK